MKTLSYLTILFSVVFIISCQSDVDIKQSYYTESDQKILSQYLDLPSEPFDYTIKYPNYVMSNVRTNINYDLATLGRVMFYDKKLSSDNSVSCESCHKQQLAFSDDVPFSGGVESRVTQRNSIALGSVINFNLYYGNHVFGAIPFFWDNSATTIQEQSERTLANPNEMNMHMGDVTKRMNELPYYRPLIKKAFGGKIQISKNEALDAIAEFVNSITNYDTKFDKSVDAHFNQARNTDIAGVALNDFTALENTGKDLFLSLCASCHGTVAGRPGQTAANNGLYVSYTDMGAGTGNRALFKVPTLRNIMRTAPYMHDGSLATIDDVLEHYSTGIKNNPGLSNQLKANNNQPKKFNFTNEQKEALKAFFATMNDDSVVSAPKFSDPFVK